MSTRYWCILAALAALLTPPAQAQQAGAPTAQPSVAVPGFWDPRRRPEQPDTSRISQIRFLTEFDYPPFNYAGPDGAPAGFNVDLARLICEELKVQCTIQMRRFDTLLAALGENRADAVIASLAVTPETRQRVEFSDPYYRASARFVARRDTGMTEVVPEAVEGIVFYTDAPFTLQFKTASQTVNQLWSNILWGQRGNFLSVPTDCPQRDERLGWMGDAEVFWRTASFNANLAAFSQKCLSCHKVEACGVYPKLGAEIANNCIDCHMPNQESRVVFLDVEGKKVNPKFRTHWIKVYRSKSAPDAN